MRSSRDRWGLWVVVGLISVALVTTSFGQLTQAKHWQEVSELHWVAHSVTNKVKMGNTLTIKPQLDRGLRLSNAKPTLAVGLLCGLVSRTTQTPKAEYTMCFVLKSPDDDSGISTFYEFTWPAGWQGGTLGGKADFGKTVEGNSVMHSKPGMIIPETFNVYVYVGEKDGTKAGKCLSNILCFDGTLQGKAATSDK
jgi:hypothetical protein